MLLSLLLLLIFPLPVEAAVKATPTLSPTPTIEPTPTTSDDIQKIREVVQQKVREKLKQIINPTTKKAFIGKVIQVDTDKLTIEFQNVTREITLNPDIAYVDLNRNKTKLSNIKVGQEILVMGIENSADNTYTAKRIVFIKLDSVIHKKTLVVGKIVDISRTSPIFTLIPLKNKNTLFQIKTDIKTEIVDKDQKKLKIADIKSGHKIITVLRPDENISKTYTAIKIIDLDFAPPPSPTPKPTR